VRLAGVERDLDPYVAARLGGAQLAHQVDDAVQLIGLEREDPLVVAKSEGRDRVGAHVGVVTRCHPVLLEDVAALLIR